MFCPRLTTLAGKSAKDQTKESRGGGTGGWEKDESAENFTSSKVKNGFGAKRVNLSAPGGNSIFNVGETDSDCFSDFLPVAVALHSGQGCSPSKVWETASDTDCVRRLFASIVVQAMVCSAAQCSPVVRTRTMTTRNFFRRATTGTPSIFHLRESSRGMSGKIGFRPEKIIPQTAPAQIAWRRTVANRQAARRGRTSDLAKPHPSRAGRARGSGALIAGLSSAMPRARLIFQISEPAAHQKIFIERQVIGDLDIQVGIKA